jgi:hypothetical protein
MNPNPSIPPLSRTDFATDCRSVFLEALAHSVLQTMPFPHRLFDAALPDSLRQALVGLPIVAPAIGETLGKRETHNSQRRFLSPTSGPEGRELAACFQDEAVVGAIEQRFGLILSGSFLRIEYCLDRDGFWLERHTDIGAKLFTLIIYLSDQVAAIDWGTDLYDGAGYHAGRAPATPGSALAFVPSATSWHGFERRPIEGVRRSLIVNYVVPEWRARHELAFPDRPIG